MTSSIKVPSTKEKLATIVSGFDEFDSEMKIGTRVGSSFDTFFFNLQLKFRFENFTVAHQLRREKDEFKIAELKNEMKRLDEDLVAEIKRRTEMNKSTQMVRIHVEFKFVTVFCFSKRSIGVLNDPTVACPSTRTCTSSAEWWTGSTLSHCSCFV